MVNGDFELLQLLTLTKSSVLISLIYIIQDGWIYSVSVMDGHSKRIIGYAYAALMTADLAVKAVQNACLNVKIQKISFSNEISLRNIPANI